MIHPHEVRQLLARFFIISSCICMFTSPVGAADGLGIRYVKENNDLHNRHHNDQRHHVNGMQNNDQGHGKNKAQGNSQGSSESSAQQHNTQRHVENNADHNSHGAVGNVESKQHFNSHHNSGSHRQQQYYNNLYYSYPRYRFYTSPRQQYYVQLYAQPYRDSRFPNSYRNNGYYQQIQPLHYGNYNNSSVNYSINAWETLAQGQVSIALNQFASEAQAYPKAGIPKIGYSLSAALSGDLRQAVVAMRDAFKIDPESLRYYQIDPRLQAMLDELIAQYQYSLNRRSRHKDEAFMVAALSYLNHDYATSYQALQRAEHDGDRSHSWKNLRDFLKETQISTRSSDQRN